MAEKWMPTGLAITAYLAIFIISMLLWDLYQYLKSLILNSLVFEPALGYVPSGITDLTSILLTGLYVGIASAISLAILKTKILQKLAAGAGIPVRDWALITLLNIPIMMLVFLLAYFILTPTMGLTVTSTSLAGALVAAVDLSIFSGFFTIVAFYVAEVFQE